MQGWAKLHRKIIDNPIFKKPDLYQLFTYCVLKANHSETKIIWNNKEEILEKGCFITGRKIIAEDTGQSESAIFRRLKVLQDLKIISVKSNNKYSVVKVLNYGVYQGEESESEQPVNNHRTTSEQPVNTDKNDKNIKNVKNEKKDISIDQFEEFWKLYPKKLAKTSALKCWKTLIKDHTSPDDLITASKNYASAMNGKEQQFMLQGSTFLGPQKRYEDYIKVSPTAKISNGKPVRERSDRFDNFYNT